MTDETADVEEGVPTPSEPLGDDDALLDEPDEEVEDEEEAEDSPVEADAGVPAYAQPGPYVGQPGYPAQPLPEPIDITNEPG